MQLTRAASMTYIAHTGIDTPSSHDLSFSTPPISLWRSMVELQSPFYCTYTTVLQVACSNHTSLACPTWPALSSPPVLKIPPSCIQGNLLLLTVAGSGAFVNLRYVFSRAVLVPTIFSVLFAISSFSCQVRPPPPDPLVEEEGVTLPPPELSSIQETFHEEDEEELLSSYTSHTTRQTKQ